jgi:hypothetical protein
MKLSGSLIAAVAACVLISCGEDEKAQTPFGSHSHRQSEEREPSGESSHATEAVLETLGGYFPLVRIR